MRRWTTPPGLGVCKSRHSILLQVVSSSNGGLPVSPTWPQPAQVLREVLPLPVRLLLPRVLQLLYLGQLGLLCLRDGAIAADGTDN